MVLLDCCTVLIYFSTPFAVHILLTALEVPARPYEFKLNEKLTLNNFLGVMLNGLLCSANFLSLIDDMDVVRC